MQVPYSDKVIDHFTSPRNVGSLDRHSADVGTGVAGEPDCGDVIRVQVEVGPGGRIADAKFKAFGCGAAIAAGSFTSEWLKGRTVDGVEELERTYISEALSLPPAKAHCSVLAEGAAKAAVADWRRKRACRIAPAARAPAKRGRSSCPSP